jgi:DNA-binding response OmpR family regulator
MRLLIVEDDQALAGFLSSALSTESENIEVESDGKQGRQRVVDEQFDLILLDLNLPGCDGVEILSAARQSQRSAAILVLTGRAAVEERVRCLDLGADDCLVKPFALSELIARTRALVRRSHALKESVLYCGDIQMDRVGRTICRAGVPIRLTPTEFALVEFLLQPRSVAGAGVENPGIVGDQYRGCLHQLSAPQAVSHDRKADHSNDSRRGLHHARAGSDG